MTLAYKECKKSTIAMIAAESTNGGRDNEEIFG